MENIVESNIKSTEQVSNKNDFFEEITENKLDNNEVTIKRKKGRPIMNSNKYIVKIEGVEYKCRTYRDIAKVTELNVQAICDILKGKKSNVKIYKKNIEIMKI